MTTLEPEDGYAVLVNTFRVQPECAETPVGLLTHATESTAQYMPGFISANLHVSLDHKRVVNYVQWRDRHAFEAAMQAPQFQAHMKEIATLVDSFEPVLYELRYAHERDRVS